MWVDWGMCYEQFGWLACIERDDLFTFYIAKHRIKQLWQGQVNGSTAQCCKRQACNFE